LSIVKVGRGLVFAVLLNLVLSIFFLWYTLEVDTLVAGGFYALRQRLRLLRDILGLTGPLLGSLAEPHWKFLAEQEKQLSSIEAIVGQLILLFVLSLGVWFVVAFCSLRYVDKRQIFTDWNRVFEFLKSLSNRVIAIAIPLAGAQLAGCFFFLASANTCRLQGLAALLNVYHPVSPEGVAGIFFLIEHIIELHAGASERAMSLAMLLVLSLSVIIVAALVTASKKTRLATIAVSIIMIDLLAASILGSALIIWGLLG